MYKRVATGLVGVVIGINCAFGYGYRMDPNGVNGWALFGAVIAVVLLAVTMGILVSNKD